MNREEVRSILSEIESLISNSVTETSFGDNPIINSIDIIGETENPKEEQPPNIVAKIVITLSEIPTINELMKSPIYSNLIQSEFDEINITIEKGNIFKCTIEGDELVNTAKIIKDILVLIESIEGLAIVEEQRLRNELEIIKEQNM